MALKQGIFKSLNFGKLGILGFLPVWLDESLTSYSLCASSYFLVMREQGVFITLFKVYSFKVQAQ